MTDATCVIKTPSVESKALKLNVPARVEVTVKTACPEPSDVTEAGEILTPTLGLAETVTAFTETGFPKGLMSVTVNEEEAVPSATREVGEATTVDREGEGFTLYGITVISGEEQADVKPAAEARMRFTVAF